MIELRGVHKELGGRPVLAGVDLLIQPGECVVITGCSGAGKTTLLRIVAGLDTPDSGAVWLRGQDATGMTPYDRALGFQFQDAALWPHMTLAGNVSFGGSGASARAAAFLKRAGLERQAARKPAEVSGGEARRAALARALAPRRDILLLDEPLSNLQPELRAQMAGWIGEELGFTKAACLWVAHDPAEAEGIACRVLTLADGKLTSVAARR